MTTRAPLFAVLFSQLYDEGVKPAQHILVSDLGQNRLANISVIHFDASQAEHQAPGVGIPDK